MQNWVLNAIQSAESAVFDIISRAKHKKAQDLDYAAELKWLNDNFLHFKSLPLKYKEQAHNLLSVLWKRMVQSNIMYPAIHEGKLYSKWDAWTEEMREMTRAGHDFERVPVFCWDFKEGMPAEYKIDYLNSKEKKGR